MDSVVFENTLQAYLIVIAIIIVGIVVIRLFKRTLLAWLKRIVQKSTSTFDDFLVEGIGNAFLPLLYFGVVYFALKSLILPDWLNRALRSEEHTSELQSLMRISYAVFCLKKKKQPPT